MRSSGVQQRRTSETGANADTISETGATTAIQVGYTVADVLAKPGYGLIILSIALARSAAEGYRAA